MFHQEDAGVKARYRKSHDHHHDDELNRIEGAFAGKGQEGGGAEVPLEDVEDEEAGGLLWQVEKTFHKRPEGVSNKIQYAIVGCNADDDAACAKRQCGICHGEKRFLDDAKQIEIGRVTGYLH